MRRRFDGELRVPGEAGPGLRAVVETDGDELVLRAGGDLLGSWRGFGVAHGGPGLFRLDIDGEESVLFAPDSAAAFATAMHLPLQPVAASDAPAASAPGLDDIVATVRPLLDPSADDDILTPGMVKAIVAAASVVATVTVVAVALL